MVIKTRSLQETDRRMIERTRKTVVETLDPRSFNQILMTEFEACLKDISEHDGPVFSITVYLNE